MNDEPEITESQMRDFPERARQLLPLMTPDQRRLLHRAVQEYRSQKIEALNLYQPLPFQEEYHASRAKETIMAKGNQAGGSLAGYAEVARAVTNQDPYRKWPKEGRCVCLGYGEGHIGRVMYPYLFRWGAFNIIQDEKTQAWRTYYPWSPDEQRDGRHWGDSHRSAQAVPAPPLVPSRFIQGKPAWKKASLRIFEKVELTTGWEILAFNTQGEVGMGMGFQCDLVHIDEDVATPGWYNEMIARLSIRQGKIRWTAMPKAHTEDMIRVIERGESQQHLPTAERTTHLIEASVFDNPYLSPAAREDNIRIWKASGEDVYRQRVFGKLSTDSQRMYPHFHRDLHNAIRRLTQEELEAEQAGRDVRSLVQKTLTESNGAPPPDWCLYFTFDPGFTTAAGLFWAVPPPAQFGTFKVIYDEFYEHSCTAAKFGEIMELKCANRTIQDFIIDAHGGRLREMGSGVLPKRQYEKELERRGIENVVRGPRFQLGSDDVAGREMVVRTWLEVRGRGHPREVGYPTLLVVSAQCPNFCREMEKFRKKMIRRGEMEIVDDKGDRGQHSHTVECCEYGAAHGLPYVAPPVRVQKYTVWDMIVAEEERAKRRQQMAAWRPGLSGTITLGPRGASP